MTGGTWGWWFKLSSSSWSLSLSSESSISSLSLISADSWLEPVWLDKLLLELGLFGWSLEALDSVGKCLAALLTSLGEVGGVWVEKELIGGGIEWGLELVLGGWAKGLKGEKGGRVNPLGVATPKK